MSNTIEECLCLGTPPPWSVVNVHGFVSTALQRLQRDGQELPECFRLSIYPWGEHNAAGGIPEAVREVTDVRSRLVHFTNCGRPYMVILFTGEQAANHQQIARSLLPWSEHLIVTRHGLELSLEYLEGVECIADADSPYVIAQCSLQSLAAQGKLADF